MNYDKILEQVLFANSVEEIDGILRIAIRRLQETSVELSDEEKTEFVLKLINLRKRLGLTKEVATLSGIRERVHNLPDKNYKRLSNGHYENVDDLYGVFSTENQFFVAKRIVRTTIYDNLEYKLVNLFTNYTFVEDFSGLIINYEGVWPSRSENIVEKFYVVKLNKILGADLDNPYFAYISDVVEYINEYLTNNPDFVKNAFVEKNGKLLIKHFD